MIFRGFLTGRGTCNDPIPELPPLGPESGKLEEADEGNGF